MIEQVIAAVAAQQQRVGTDAVVEAVWHGADDVVIPAVGIELEWSTSVILESDDLSRADTSTGRPGVDWDFAAARLRTGQPEHVALGARSASMAAVIRNDFRRYDPRVEVAKVRAQFPMEVSWAEEPVGALRVAVAMQRWALLGGGVTLEWAAQPLTEWFLGAAAAIDADTGFVALSEGPLWNGNSPWEVEQGLVGARRDVAHEVWGFGWLTLLGPRHLAVIGGRAALEGLPDSQVEGLPGGRVVVRLGDDPVAVPAESLAALQAVLAPVLRR